MRGAEVLSEKEPPFVIVSASCCRATRPTRGWGTPWVPHAGLGDAVGAAVPTGIPPVGTQQENILGVEMWLILL